jgi:hypothetical protein
MGNPVKTVIYLEQMMDERRTVLRILFEFHHSHS